MPEVFFRNFLPEKIYFTKILPITLTKFIPNVRIDGVVWMWKKKIFLSEDLLGWLSQKVASNFSENQFCANGSENLGKWKKQKIFHTFPNCTQFNSKCQKLSSQDFRNFESMTWIYYAKLDDFKFIIANGTSIMQI